MPLFLSLILIRIPPPGADLVFFENWRYND